MSNQYCGQEFAERQLNAQVAGEPKQNPFIEYLIPRRIASSVNNRSFNETPSQATDRDPSNRGFVDAAPGQMSNRVLSRMMQIISHPELEPAEYDKCMTGFATSIDQSNGKLSPQLYYACSQIWHFTMKPRDVDHLLYDVNTHLQKMHSPFSITCEVAPLYPAQVGIDGREDRRAYPGTQPSMDIMVLDKRNQSCKRNLLR